MTTLIQYQTSGGKKGRCDARCYNAKHDNCKCICGGANHAKGEAKARKNVTLFVNNMVKIYEQKHKTKVKLKTTQKEIALL